MIIKLGLQSLYLNSTFFVQLVADAYLSYKYAVYVKIGYAFFFMYVLLCDQCISTQWNC